MQEIIPETIKQRIYTIRGIQIMIDSDLAKLYGIETKRLNEQVKRNMSRFPVDFLIKCDFNDLKDLRSQFGVANPITTYNRN